MKVRKKPVEVEAFRFGYDKPDLWWKAAVDSGVATVWERDAEPPFGADRYATIQTLEGQMEVRHGDWIIRGVKGELYPCKPDIFDMTYDVSDLGISAIEAERAGE